MRKAIGMIGLILAIGTKAFAQGYVDQQAVEPVLESQIGDISNIQPVQWQVYDYIDHNKKDKKGVWSELLSLLDSMQGSHSGERRYIVEMTNRVTGENFKTGRQLILPTSFPEDFRAYSPYPFEYNGAKEMPKLLVIDKTTQTFGAYEYGKLVRWGIVSTGEFDDRTPPGRYNFNWKAEYRESSAAPEGEVWKLYWMFNFHARYGIHVHQYALPIGYPASHGCVRLTEADAKWNFNWANGWIQEGGRVKRNGTPLMIIGSNPIGRPTHWAIEGDKVVSLVQLPDNPDEVPAGTEAQQQAAWASGW